MNGLTILGLWLTGVLIAWALLRGSATHVDDEEWREKRDRWDGTR